MSQHDTLLAAFEAYKAENEKFIEKGIKASAARARKALQEIAGACKERRKEITATKEAMEAKKEFPALLICKPSLQKLGFFFMCIA